MRSFPSVGQTKRNFKIGYGFPMVLLYLDRHFQIFENGPKILDRNANIRKK